MGLIIRLASVKCFGKTFVTWVRSDIFERIVSIWISHEYKIASKIDWYHLFAGNGCVLGWWEIEQNFEIHCIDVIMTTMASQITSLTVVYSIAYSDADQRKHQSSASLTFVRGIHRGPVNSPHKGPVTRKMFPFDDVIMYKSCFSPCEYIFVCCGGTLCLVLQHSTYWFI